MSHTMLTTRVSHHAAYSGYDLLASVAAATGRCEVVSATEEDVRRSVARRLMIRGAGREWYEFRSAYLEQQALRRLPVRGGALHFLWGDQSLAFATRPPRRRAIAATFHQPPSLLAKLKISKRTIQRLDLAVVLSGHQRDYFEGLLGTDRVALVPHGVDTTFFTPDDSARDDSCLVVGQWLRDVELLEKTAAALYRAAPHVRVRLVGAASMVKRQLAERPNVQVLPRLTDDELLSEYRRAGVFLMPVTDSTANCALLEALACGCPIVANDVGGVREYVPAASLVLERDPEALAHAVQVTLSRRDPTVEAASRARALELDWRPVANQMLDQLDAISS